MAFDRGDGSTGTGSTSVLPVVSGGTGTSTLTGVVKGTGTAALTAGTVNLASEVTGTLPVSNGGTGANTAEQARINLGIVEGEVSSNVTYSPLGTGSVDTTVQSKLRETVSRQDYNSDANYNSARNALTTRVDHVVRTEGAPTDRLLSKKLSDFTSVKDFGAVGDGIADDSSAFNLAIAASSQVLVPKGTYKLNTNVLSSTTVFVMQDATITGDGHLQASKIINVSSNGLYTSNQNGYIESNNLRKSFSQLATTNLTNFPKKYYPTAAWIELLRLSPAVTAFESSDGSQTNAMNETYIREVVREMASNGIQSIVLPYVEYIGFWFYKPGFSYPYDYDTARTGKFWGDWLTGYSNVAPFDAVKAILEEAAKLGLKVYIGLGRNGDSSLLNDLYSVNILGNPDPNRFGLSLATRVSNATNRTREVAADLISQYNHIPSFEGFYISHEPDHVESANDYLTPATQTSGTNPSLRSYNKPIILAPPSPIDLAATSTFANVLIATGCDIIAPQDSVGPGYNFTTGLYTYIPTVAVNALANHFEIWRKVSAIANAKQTLTDRSIALWSVTETWQMGIRPATALTLSATSGASVTATAGASSFVSGDVGKWISTADGGNAQITAFTSATVVTVSTAVSSGTAFGSTSQTSGNWSLNTQYSNDYPADITRIKSQLSETWPYVESVSLYAWLGFIDSGTLSLRLSQNNSGRTDYRTLAANFYQGYAAWYKGQKLKYSSDTNVNVIQQQFFERGSATAATSLTSDFATFYPKHDGSRVVYFCVIRGFLSSGTSTLTMGLRVNGVAVKTSQDVVSSNSAGGTYTFMFSETPKGLSRNVGISFSSSSANFNLLGSEIYAIETV